MISWWLQIIDNDIMSYLYMSFLNPKQEIVSQYYFKGTIKQIKFWTIRGKKLLVKFTQLLSDVLSILKN